MTSIRPKLKPETHKAVTAWQTQTGQTVWMSASGSWSTNPAEIGAFTGEDAEAALSKARSQEGEITDPYFMQVTPDGRITGRETLRETIRAKGPTVPYGEIF